jgi:hypothetical protein
MTKEIPIIIDITLLFYMVSFIILLKMKRKVIKKTNGFSDKIPALLNSKRKPVAYLVFYGFGLVVFVILLVITVLSLPWINEKNLIAKISFLIFSILSFLFSSWMNFLQNRAMKNIK